MKKFGFIALFIGALFLVGCFSPVEPDPGVSKGTLQISLEDGSRSILPDYAGLASSYEITLLKDNGDIFTQKTFLQGQTILIKDIPPATYNLEILGLDDSNTPILQGSKTLAIKKGSNSTTAALEGLLSGFGALDLQISFDLGEGIDQVQYSLVPLDSEPNMAPIAIQGNLVRIQEDNLAAGSWDIKVNFYKEGFLRGQYFRSALINGNITTQHSEVYEDFGQSPTAPSSLRATYERGVITLNWIDNSTTETSFILEKAIDGGSWTYFKTLTANSQSTQDNDLSADTQLSYRIKSENSFGESSWAVSNSVTIPPLPVPVATPVITPNGGTIQDTDMITISTTTPGASIYFTLGGAAPTTSSTLYTGAFSLSAGNDQEIRAIAVADGYLVSAEASALFNVQGEETSGILIHVKNFSHAYSWTVNEGVTTPHSGAWPGTSMTQSRPNWRTIAFPELDYLNIIFSNSGSGQTEDLEITEGEWWYDGSWHTGDPEDTIAPTVTFTSPQNGWSGSSTVELRASATDNNGVTKVEFWDGATLLATDNTSPYSYLWDTAQSQNGTRMITAKAFDSAGNTATDSITITTTNLGVPPVASAGRDQKVLQGSEVFFDGSSSYDPNGTIVSYSWSNGLTSSQGYVTYHNLGSYTVTLTVTDDEGLTASDSIVVEVVEKIPHRDFREETVYFIMTDRFADGDPNNNNIWGDEFLPDPDNVHSMDSSKTGMLSYYHGGDFQGIIDNLDYIQNLGFTAIWITPVVKQPEGRHIYDPNDPITGNGGDYYAASPFHGYWGYDFDQIDPHLHSSGPDNDGWEDFGNLVAELHARDMKIMLDVVTNHGHPTAVSQASSTFDTRNEIIMDGQTWVWETQDPYYTGGGDGNGFFSYENGTWLIDLIDFNENGENNAREHLFNVYKKFIDYGVDAFRVDTVAYMTSGFWEDFAQEMTDHARSLGNEHFYMAGEAWTGDRTAALDLIYNGGSNTNFHMLDLHGSSMDFPGWMSAVFKGERGFENPNSWQRIAGPQGDESGLYDPTYLATFVDNHDVTRANGVLTKNQYKNNLTYIYLFRGIPVVFYGTEILYSSWPYYITTTDKNDVVARWMLGERGISYVENNQPELALHLKMLNTLRRSSPALQKGQQVDILMEGEKAVFKRDFGERVAFVAMTTNGGYTHTFSEIPTGNYRLITPQGNGTYTETPVSITGGTYSVTVPANGFVVLEK